MRRFVVPVICFIFGAGAVVIVLLLSGAEAATSPCTKVGTSGPDSISGTAGSDYICARGGDDYAHGQAGNDTILGEDGADTLVGGAARDDVRGGAGNDQLFVVDQTNGNDKVDGGPGSDRCYLDNRDVARDCETVERGASAVAFAALDAEFYGLTVLAESFQPLPSESPSVSPQCTPPPQESPASCPSVTP